MITTRSDNCTASLMLCVTNKIVWPISCRMRSNSSPKMILVCSSSAPNGSSISKISGSITSARAIATRCFIPPES